MGLLDDLRRAINANLTETRKAGVAVTSTAREVTLTSGLQLPFSWSLQDLPTGWTLTGYEYCFEGWDKASDSENVQYRSGYDSQAQPRPIWQKIATTEPSMSKSFPVSQAGHYTLHVRALLQGSGGQVTSAYEGNHTYLVKSALSGGSRPKR